jgi:hypothetical protein
MEGTVQKRGVSKKGSPMLTIDGKLYFAGKCDVSTLRVGDRISFDGHAFSEDGKLWSIDSYTLIEAERKYAPSAGNASIPLPETPEISEPHLRFISNCVGSALLAKTVTTPEEIDTWYTKLVALVRRVQ